MNVQNVIVVSRKGWVVYPVVKRTFDLAAAVLIIIGVLSWVLPLMAVLIKLDSRGPVLFIQRRIGRGGKLFWCYKLRTMVVNEFADVKPASDDDERITRVGRWLRRTHLDELPQFFNVLYGSMSLVGPRPYMPADGLAFGKWTGDPFRRTQVKPGITGLAQSKGLHGSISGGQVVSMRYQWDAFYVDHANLQLDIRILWDTITLMVVRRIAGNYLLPGSLALLAVAMAVAIGML